MDLKELAEMQGQSRREIELAEERGMPTLPAKRRPAAVNKEISKIKRVEPKRGQFDLQQELF